MKRSILGRQISLVVLGDAITTVSIMVSGMFLARLLSKDDMGTYRQIQYLGLLAVGIAEFGLSSTIYRYWPVMSPEGRAIFTKMLLLVSTGISLAATVLLAALAPWLATSYSNPALAPGLMLGALFPLSAIPLKFVRPALICNGSSIKATSLELLFEIIPVLAIVLPVYLGMSFLGALWVWSAACMARLVVVPIVFREYLLRDGRWWERGLFRRIFEYLWPIQVSRIPGLLITYFDKVVMSVFFPPSVFAVYSMGAREVPFVGTVGPSVSTVLIAHLVEDKQEGRIEQIARRWRKACLKTAMLTYPVAAFCIVYAVPVMKCLFSATYEESSRPFSVFAAIIFVRVIEYGSLARVYDRTKLILHSSLATFAAVALLGIPLAWSFGMLGMALSVLLSYMVSAAYYIVAYRRLLDTPVTSFFPFLSLLILLVTSFASVGLSSWLMGQIVPLSGETAFFVLSWKLGVHFIFTGVLYVMFKWIAGLLLSAFDPPAAAELRLTFQ